MTNAKLQEENADLRRRLEEAEEAIRAIRSGAVDAFAAAEGPEMLLQAKADGSYLKMLTRLAKVQLLIVDELFLTPLDDSQRNDLLEIIEDRYHKAPTVITSQCPIKDWHPIIGEPTVADAILDRLLHHSFKIELKGDSI